MKVKGISQQRQPVKLCYNYVINEDHQNLVLFFKIRACCLRSVEGHTHIFKYVHPLQHALDIRYHCMKYEFSGLLKVPGTSDTAEWHEHLLNKYKVLSSIPHTKTKQKAKLQR